MSKFIQTQCDSLVNVDTISSIQKRKTNINDDLVLIEYIIKNNKKQEFVYNRSYFDYSIEQNEDYICEDGFCYYTINEIVDFIENTNSYLLKSKVKYNFKRFKR